MNIFIPILLLILWIVFFGSFVSPLMTGYPIQAGGCTGVTAIVFYLFYNIGYNAGLNKNSK